MGLVADNEQSQYELILKVAGSLISAEQLKLLKFALALRMFSPTVEMYNAVSCEIDVNLQYLG